MTDSADSELTTEHRWIVYSVSHLGGVGRFLGVADSQEEAQEIGEKWWTAFAEGEKAEPEDYAGISWKPVADFDEWKRPDDV